MLGQKNREIPTDRVINMQKQGLQSNQIISSLQGEGYKHEQIVSAMDQAKVKDQLSNTNLPKNNQIDNPPNIPLALMNAPSPSQQNSQNNESNDSMNLPESEFSAPGSSGFAPEPLERASYDAIEEIAESIIKEKWDELVRGVGDIRLWKERIDIDLEGVKQELVRTQEKFENLQKAIMGRIKEYSEGVTNISTEMRALEKVLEKILSPITKSVRDLQEVTEKVTRRRSFARKPAVKKKIIKKTTSKKKKKK